uniref:Uncharacterized protein n=1 Tax=Arundo donax TaxID=35708 RepID=A0A0A9CJH7_ARUDO
MEDVNQQKPENSSIQKLCEIFSKVFEQQQLKTAPEVMKHTLSLIR